MTLIVWSAVGFYAAKKAELAGISVVYYNRGAPITPHQLYAVSAGIFLIGVFLAWSQSQNKP